MSEAARTHNTYTWDDYRSWDDRERWELVGGEAVSMSPAPSPRHQRIQQELGRQLGNHFLDRPCQVFPAPIDVRLSDFDVVQPDLAIVCDGDRVKPTHIEGPPTLVIEILSPSTAVYDRGRKLELYARSGVRDVWLVTPYPSLIEVYRLDGATYRFVHARGKDEAFACPSFPELRLDLSRVFDFPLEPGEEVPRVGEGRRPPYKAGAGTSLPPRSSRGDEAE